MMFGEMVDSRPEFWPDFGMNKFQMYGHANTHPIFPVFFSFFQFLPFFSFHRFRVFTLFQFLPDSPSFPSLLPYLFTYQRLDTTYQRSATG